MTQNSKHDAYVPWGEPGPPAPAMPLMALITVPALLAHIVIMLTTVSVLTMVNLLATPQVWWSLAILAIWFILVIIHGIALASRGLLLDEEPAAASRPASIPQGPPVPGWLSLARRDREPSVPQSWELSDDPPASWPEQTAEQESPPEPPPPPERVPWRAATDIAWLRRPPRDASGDGAGEPPPGKEASS